jgi:hypothetical protein
MTKALDRRSAVDEHKSFIDAVLRESPSITSKRVGVLPRERVLRRCGRCSSRIC